MNYWRKEFKEMPKLVLEETLNYLWIGFKITLIPAGLGFIICLVRWAL